MIESMHGAPPVACPSQSSLFSFDVLFNVHWHREGCSVYKCFHRQKHPSEWSAGLS